MKEHFEKYFKMSTLSIIYQTMKFKKVEIFDILETL